MSIVRNANDPELKDQLKPQPHDEGNTAQGFYIVGADGKFYGWNNTHYIPEVIRFMDSALNSFRRNPPKDVEIASTVLNDQYSTRLDPSTSVVRIYTRIRPIPAGCDELNRGIGRDQLWIYSDDVEEILRRSQESVTFMLPENLVGRIVRFHLIDNVRGEPDEWQPAEVKTAKFTAQLVGRDSRTKRFAFTGAYAQVTKKTNRGQQGNLQGTFDVIDNKIANFRAFGQAVAWGESRFTPGAPQGKFGLVFAMVSTQDQVVQSIPPQAVWEDGEYYHYAVSTE